MKLAEALVLRKHLTDKVKQLEPLKVNGDQGLFELKTKRTKLQPTKAMTNRNAKCYF